MTANTQKMERAENTQVLTFRLGKRFYAIDILAVQEIHGWIAPREIPDTPAWIVGVLDWRGTVVPIVDLRVRFGEQNVDYSKTTVVVILQMILKAEELSEETPVTIGIVVDAVSDVIPVNPKEVRKAPNFGQSIDTRFIAGMLVVGEEMIVLLDLSKLMNLDLLVQTS